MKSTNLIEIENIGTLKLYPIKEKEKEFEMVSKDFKPLHKEVAEKGKTSRYKWLDNEGKEYNKNEVGYKIACSQNECCCYDIGNVS